MAQISAQITQILPAFNRRATYFSLSGRRKAICDICESICDICGFRDFGEALGIRRVNLDVVDRFE